MHKVTFWILAYLSHDAKLLALIRQETSQSIEKGVLNIPSLLERSPQLESVYLEVLRLKMASSLMRSVTEPTVVGGKLLEKGKNVLVPYRQLHYAPDVWGSDASTFKPERFLNNKNLSRHPSYRPFGGGQHLCPGRFVAKQTVFAFIALTLSRYDIQLDESYAFPRADERKPGLGCLGPLKGDQVRLTLRPRPGNDDES